MAATFGLIHIIMSINLMPGNTTIHSLQYGKAEMQFKHGIPLLHIVHEPNSKEPYTQGTGYGTKEDNELNRCIQYKYET